MTSAPIISPKKLIEVALPLDAINVEGSRRKRKAPGGYPTAFHKWWAQRPVAAARAVVFAQLINDPEDLWYCQNPGQAPTPQHRGHWTRERTRLFKLIEDLIKWDNTTNRSILDQVRKEIRRSWKEVCKLNANHPQAQNYFNTERIPSFLDPFAGSGAIPQEAQRFGLECYASDLNPVAVLINKATIEIPPKFSGMSPVFPYANDTKSLVRREWKRTEGIAEDVRRYAKWIYDEAQKQIGWLYPTVTITNEMAKDRPDLEPYEGREINVVAWMWARTVKSPNPAFSHVHVPLISNYVLSSKKGRQAYIEPVVEGDSYRFDVKVGPPPSSARMGTSAGKRKAFRCLISGSPMGYEHIRKEAKAGRMGHRLIAIVGNGKPGRLYLSPDHSHEIVAAKATPSWKPDCEMPKKHRNFQPPVYGIDNFGDLFTPRQLVALTTFSDLISDAREKILKDAIAAGMSSDSASMAEGICDAKEYSESLAVYLTFILTRALHYLTSNASWLPKDSAIRSALGKQAFPMVWDYVEANPFEQSSAGWLKCCDTMSKCIEFFPVATNGTAIQANASTLNTGRLNFISTDPPYYDNVSYAELSDFFYLWLRRCLRDIYPELLSTIAVPKSEELIAAPHRHGGLKEAEAFFLEGMTNAMSNLEKQAHPAAPVTIYYAFKQSETKEDLTHSTGWETFLEAVLRSGFSITGTWPMRTEADNRQVSQGTNSLASSVVLVCRPRLKDAGTISRREFIRELNARLPKALDDMTRKSEGLPSPVAPVDLSQAIVGPGMAIFSKYKAVLEADGLPMSVKTALQLINRFLAEDDFDAGTQFCLHWFEEHGWESDAFGSADVLARAKATSVNGLADAGVIQSGGGKVRLLKWTEYPSDWDSKKDFRTLIWEALHHLIRAFKYGGEYEAGKVLAGVVSKAEAARQLAYRLYTLCERKGWAEDARAYNELITSWAAIESAAPKLEQRELF